MSLKKAKMKYRERNRVMINKVANVKHACLVCGGSYSTSTKARHYKTNKCKKAYALQIEHQDNLPLYHQNDPY